MRYLLLLFCCVTMNFAFGLPLVEDNQPRVALVLAQRPTRSAELAALELQAHIQQQTGTKLPIINESEALPDSLKPFYLGKTKTADDLGFRPKDQQALLHVSSDKAILFGSDEEEFGNVDYFGTGAWPGFESENPVARLGTLLGAYEILQRYGGIRWYMPTEVGTHIPRKADFRLPKGKHTFENWTKRRVLGSGQWGMPGSPGQKDLIGVVRVTKPISDRDRNLFALRSRRGGEPFAVNHSMRQFQKRFGEQHPEWWVDNIPAPEKQLRYYLPKVTNQIIHDARDYFDKPLETRNTGVPGISWARGNYWGVMPNDNRDYGTETHPPLQPERAVVGRYGSGVVSNYIFDWVNRVARGVAKTHPDAWISTSAYAGMFEPPEFAMEPNVAVSVAMGDGWDAKSQQILKDWAKQTNRLFTWEYHYAWGRMFPLRPYAIGEYAEVLRKIGLRGMYMEMGDHNPALYHIDYHLMTQALLSLDLDVERELQQYYTNFYGPAAKPMQAFWETLFEASKRSRKASAPSESWLVADKDGTGERLKALIDEAQALSRGNPLVQERIEVMEKGVLQPYFEELENARKVAKHLPLQLRVTVTEHTVQLDGKLDDAIWLQAEESSSFVTMYNELMPVKTTVRVVRERDALVFGFHCEEPDMQNLVTHHLSPSAGICTDDSVEMNISFPGSEDKQNAGESSGMLMRPSGGRENYLQLMANTAGFTWHWWRGKYNPGEPESLGIKSAVAKLENAWQIEIRIPLSILEDTSDLPETLGANFMRNRPRGQNSRTNAEGRAVWNPTFSQSFHISNRFGVLIFSKNKSN